MALWPMPELSLDPARPVAPTTLPCHSRCISAIHTLIHKENKAEWPTRTTFWSMATSKCIAHLNTTESSGERFVWISGSYCAMWVNHWCVRSCPQTIPLRNALPISQGTGISTGKMTSQLSHCTYCLPERRTARSSEVAEEEARWTGGARVCKY